ncbi:MAG TPA: hypothetical protein EYO33_26900 [Phycisphaerales bacterium]|nr:hypothetical protein [Phycisphaerales bacterium]
MGIRVGQIAVDSFQRSKVAARLRVGLLDAGGKRLRKRSFWSAGLGAQGGSVVSSMTRLLRISRFCGGR